jgi:hypothetical protein
MGWSQISMLQRYGHVNSAMKNDAARRLEVGYPVASAMG